MVCMFGSKVYYGVCLQLALCYVQLVLQPLIKDKMIAQKGQMSLVGLKN